MTLKQLSIIILLSLLLSSLPCDGQPTESSRKPGLIGAPISCTPKSADMQIRERIVSLILSATPKESCNEGPPEKTVLNCSSILFDVDATGLISNLKVIRISDSIARDFWTMWAVVSCPPSKIEKSVKTVQIDNLPISYETTQIELEERKAQEKLIQRKLGASRIYFALIPPTFLQVFPGMFSNEEIFSKTNMIGINLSALSPKGADYWSLGAANDAIKTNRPVSYFLSEWNSFFKKHLKPSKSDVKSFAQFLKHKYKDLIQEGEPEAPLP